MTHEELLPLARELAQQHGEALTLTAVQRHIRISRARLLKLCGSWSQLRSAIGLLPDGPHARDPLSNEMIRDKLRAAIAQCGANIKRAEFCQMTGYSPNLISKRWGSWAQLRQSLGLAPHAKMENHYTDQEIIDEAEDQFRKCST